MSEQDPSPLNSAIEELFKDSVSKESVVATLPSKGIGYKNIPAEITVKTLTFEDEKHLTTLDLNSNFIDELLKRCTNIEDPDSLYLFDKLFAVVMMRKASFGDAVKLKTVCRACAAENNLEVNISELPVDYVPDDFSGYIEVDLVDLNKKAKVRLATGSDQDYLSTKDKILDNLWRFVLDIGGYNQAPIINAAIKKLTSRDVKSLVEALKFDEAGIQTNAHFICSNCKTKGTTSIPFTEAFF